MTVDCGATVRLKSRSYAIGSPSPLLEMMRRLHSPENMSSFSMGQVDISEVKSGSRGISVH